MFIQCSECEYKYLVNSADLKPDGRMVECANCNHRWFQEPIEGEELLSSSVLRVSNEKSLSSEQDNKTHAQDLLSKEIKNLPSTVVKEKKVSVINTFLVIFLLILLFVIFWTFRSYGANIFVLINFYINAFILSFAALHY